MKHVTISRETIGCVGLRAGTYEDVARRTTFARRKTSYVQKYAEIEHVSISAFHDVGVTTSYDFARSVNAADTLHVFN